MAICPICGEEVLPRTANKAHPFCSERCRTIDLGKWLNEEYRVPAGPDESLGEGEDGNAGQLEAELLSRSKTDMRH
ncbi:MAG: hypothetical protein JWP97_4622 [Labilithrix sp.]|nr:hypothetical protein [Labilithrix sp.]